MSAFDTYLEYVKPFKGSMRFHKWAALSALGAILERRTWLNLGGLGRIYPNLYIVLCSGPGLGKTTASNLACNLLKEYNQSLGPSNGGVKFGPDKMTPAALIKRFSESTKTIRSDVCPPFEQSALYLHSTELATMIRDIGGGTLSDDMLKLYDNDDYFEKETIGGGVSKIAAPCLNFLGDTTPAFLSGYLPAEESGTGLTARIIFAVEMGRVEMDEEVPDGDSALRARLLANLRRMHQIIGPATLSPDASVLWKEVFHEIRERMFRLPDGSFLRNFYARKAIHTKKIALILSAARDSSRIVSKDDIELSLSLLADVEPFMDKIFGVKDISKTTDASKRILDTIPYEPEEIEEGVLKAAVFRGGMAGEARGFNERMLFLLEGRLAKKRIEPSGATFYTKIFT